MDDQAVQPAPPPPYARPQQSTDSPAGSLPTETLTHILDLALQDLVPLERQTIRMVFSSVCKHWWSVAPKTDELVVHGSKQAERLSTALLNEEFAFRQEAIRALVITVGKETSPKASTLVGDLLLSCPLLERLNVTLDQGFSGGYGTLGKGFRDSLASCDTLTELEMYGKIEMAERRSPSHIFTNLLSLRRIVTPSLRVTSWVYAFQRNSSPNKLQQLVMPFESSRGAVTELLTPAAAYLVDVKLLGGADWTGHSHYLTPFIKSLTSIRRLVIGPFAYDLATLFNLLADLPTLKSFTLTSEPATQTQLQSLHGVTSTAAVRYIATAQQLKSLTLTDEIQRWWTELEQVQVKEAAEKAGVEFTLR
ncbi:hypothetical protein BCR35DRAFT_300866 [Leucosporidium creatinivorum]|uniref:F-box domain-containing protein n=1 Tax=Leucosporidium creatinivorum TaxID=106004 RepID=A0A1Y2FYG6_9BASI|nr:hypothetical protein BCR35DRAFT_300866 [Leucosporidium creatinivorum]